MLECVPKLGALGGCECFKLVNKECCAVAVSELLERALLLEMLKEMEGLEGDKAPFALVEQCAGAVKFLCEFFAFVGGGGEIKKGPKVFCGKADLKGRGKGLLKTGTNNTTTRKDFTNVRQ